MISLPFRSLTGWQVSSDSKLPSSSHNVSDSDMKALDLSEPGQSRILLETKGGLMSFAALVYLILWYFFSGCTLFLNKYILETLEGDASLLAFVQMLMTTICGFIQTLIPLSVCGANDREGKPPHFLKDMILVGAMRFAAVILGLVALKHIAVSFTETVKSSAPIFTVIIARLVINERTGLLTNISLVPIMFGLALCSSYELSFNLLGFLAALMTNVAECFQNVYSKMLISGEKYRYTASELQFYTSLASILIQIPACLLISGSPMKQRTTDYSMIIALLINGTSFHFQSFTAYVLMGHISPVTHSVANTVKRAVLIWLSVLMFANRVTFLSGLGTFITLGGVLLFNKAKEYDKNRRRPAVFWLKSSNP